MFYDIPIFCIQPERTVQDQAGVREDLCNEIQYLRKRQPTLLIYYYYKFLICSSAQFLNQQLTFVVVIVSGAAVVAYNHLKIHTHIIHITNDHAYCW